MFCSLKQLVKVLCLSLVVGWSIGMLIPTLSGDGKVMVVQGITVTYVPSVGYANTDGKVIYIGNEFLKLNDKDQQVVLAHEMGHIVSGHLAHNRLYLCARNIMRIVGSIFNHVQQVELDADKYACAIYGKVRVVNTLSKIADELDPISAREMRVRVKALQDDD